MKCIECDGEIVIKEVPYYYKDQLYLGDFEAEVCLNCGTKYFTEKAYSEIEKVAKVRKMWGINRLPDTETLLTAKNETEIPTINPLTLFGDSILPREAQITVVGVVV